MCKNGPEVRSLKERSETGQGVSDFHRSFCMCEALCLSRDKMPTDWLLPPSQSTSEHPCSTLYPLAVKGRLSIAVLNSASTALLQGFCI